MTTMTCDTARDVLPELATGRLEGGPLRAVEHHLRECAECRATLETLELLVATRPAVPGDLASRIQASASRELRSPAPGAVRRRPARRWHLSAPVWGLAAAAVLALVMGRTLLPGGEGEPEFLALGDADLPVLLADDGMVAGGPVLDGLSDDDLALLLEELEP